MIRKIMLILCAALLLTALIALPAYAAAADRTLYCETCGVETTHRVVSNDDDTHSWRCAECHTTRDTASCSYGQWSDSDGYCVKVCEVCSGQYTKEHNYGAWTVNKTMKWHVHTCADCGHSEHHNYNFAYSDGGDYCIKACQNKGCDISSTVEHSYSDWTFDGSKCVRKCVNCGHEQSHEPSVSSWTNVSETQHSGTCATCGTTVTVNHDFKLNHDSFEHWYECVCGALQGATEAHTGTWTHSDGQCQRTCSVCLNFDSHSWNVSSWSATDGGCQGTCAMCGETFVKPHNPSSAYDYRDENGHAFCCADCGAKATETEAHTFVYKYSDTEHWQECSICGYTTAHVAHSYADYTEDGTNCTGTCVCGKTSTHAAAASVWQPSADGSVCETTCAICHRVMTKAHTQSDVLSFDDENHWYACAVCGAVMDELTPHCYDALNLGDGTHQMTCECGATLSEPEAHSYSWYDQGDGTHAQECVCGETNGVTEKHTFEWQTIDGTHYYICADCSYVDSAKTHAAGEGSEMGCTLVSCTKEEHVHSYSDWVYDYDAIHRADCACGESRLNVACVYVPFTLKSVVYEICPVCGNIRDVVTDEEGNIVDSVDAEIVAARVHDVKTVFADEKIDADIDVLIDEMADGTKLLSIGFDRTGVLARAEEVEEGETPITYTLTVTLPEGTFAEGTKLVSVDDESTVVATAEEDGSATIELALCEELDIRFVIEDGEAKG